METIALKVNGREVAGRPGQTILDLVREQGLDDIPTLCHSPELAPYGSCFLCTVEVKGRPSLVPSCATRIAPGMEVTTRNDRIVASRRTALELLLSNHYADCLSPCLLGCPAHVDAQGYIALAAMGEHRAAVDLIRERNPFPAACGRVCVRKCEVVCRRADVDAAVGINAVKRYVTDAPGVYDGGPAPVPATGRSVGVVGGGPAGLTAAWFLARRGHAVTVYEAMPRAGGMLRYGIPAYRLPDAVLDQEIDFIRRAGVEIRYGVRVGAGVALDDLRRSHDALFLAAGAWTAKPMRVAGEDSTAGVVKGVDFLREKAEDPSPMSGTVVVVGGGNTAMDVARTSWRCGAEKVILLYRRTRAEMPADPLEIHDCLEEGIEIMELAAPTGIVAEAGRLKALRCIRMKLGEPDASGRPRPVPMEGSEFDLPCQLAVSAIGQDPLLAGLKRLGDQALALTKWETIKVDPRTLATSIPGVFAGGDAADDGPTVVIDAIADGQRAAAAIHAHLAGEPLPAAPFAVQKEFWAKPGKAELGEVPESPRHEVHARPVAERRGSFVEVATGFEPEDAAHEAARCLSCGCLRFDDCGLRLYAEQYGVDMNRWAGYVRKHRVDDRHPWIVYDPNKCILCARCIRTCSRVLPISALGLVGRGFRTEMRPAMNDPLAETNCVSCGNCIDACPTGALTAKHPFPGRACLPAAKLASHCGFCSLGCAVTASRYGGAHVAVSGSGRPGDYLCRFGRFGHEIFVRRRRLRRAAVRTAEGRREADLPEALALAADGLRRVVERHGPQAVAVLASPELSGEELWLAARIAREGLGTGNVGSLTALLTGREAGQLDGILGLTASTADREVLAAADLVVCNNTAAEADHLPLAVTILQRVRQGARLIVANSTLDTADRFLATLAIDPMRGRSTALWTAVAAALVEAAGAGTLAGMPGWPAFHAALPRDLAAAAALAGVGVEEVRRAAALLREARRVVFVHSPDRAEDQAAGDMEALANLVLLLRRAGQEADLLLPALAANWVGLEVAGCDPAFLPGRRPAAVLPGAASRSGLLAHLAEGRIRGALLLGEDPLRDDRVGAWLQGLEHLVAMDWARTETTELADVALPGSTFLEAPGTRLSFEGRRLRGVAVVPPPAGIAGWEVLAGLGRRLGLQVPREAGELAGALEATVRAGLGALAPFYWNTGEARPALPEGTLAAPQEAGRPGRIRPALTHGERYRRELREVGGEHYRVH